MSGFSGSVVVGYHADSSGRDALALGATLARSLSLPLLVVKVYPDPAPIGPGRVDAEWVASRRSASEAVLKDAEGRLSGASLSDVDYLLLPAASAARGLSDLALEVDAAVIVVGSAETEGYAGGRVLAGSTAGRLLSGAERPVAIAPHGYAQRSGSDRITRVCVAYQDTDEGRHAAGLAADVATRAGGSFMLVTSLDAVTSTTPWTIGGEEAESAFVATARESFQSSLDAEAIRLSDATGAAPQTQLLIGDVVQTLADLDTDLMFVGSRGYGPIRTVLLGGLSSRLVRRAGMPLVVVPRP